MYIQTFQFSLNLIPDFVVILSCHVQYYTLLEKALKKVWTKDQHRLHTKDCRSCYYQLRQLRSVAQSLSAEAVKAVVHTFISSRLDYCNSLLTSVNEGLLRRLRSVQNAAARLITGTRRCEHITSALQQLHWLPVRQRIQYKLASLAFRALSSLAPDYLAGDSQLVAVSGRCTETPAVRGATRLPCATSEQHFRWPFLRCRRPAHMERSNELPFSLRDAGLSLTILSTNIW